jgi:tellurite resistance protein
MVTQHDAAGTAFGVADERDVPITAQSMFALALWAVPEPPRIEHTVGSRALKEKLEHLRGLLSHSIQSGDLAAVVERALDLAIERLEKQRFAKTERPRLALAASARVKKKRARASQNREHIPNATRRAVFERMGCNALIADRTGSAAHHARSCRSTTKIPGLAVVATRSRTCGYCAQPTIAYSPSRTSARSTLPSGARSASLRPDKVALNHVRIARRKRSRIELEVMSGNDLQALGEAKLEALVEVMFLAASADGEFSVIERAHFLKSVESLTDGRIATSRLQELVDEAGTALDRDGRDARLASVKERLPDVGARRVALSLAIQVTATDGIIRTSERELILDAADALEIDRDEAADLVKKLTR